MGSITIQEYTTKTPLQMIGTEAGVCWNANTTDPEKNFARGKDCVLSEHGRTWEFPQVYMILEGYSARTIRELYTHIGGSPTRLQASTRYIDYGDFQYVVPESLKDNETAKNRYEYTMHYLSETMKDMEAMGVPREDIAMMLPLGMATKVVLRTNFRNLVDMAHQRLCNRAYWEFRQLMQDMKKALGDYSDEWNYLVWTCMKPKCAYLGRCTEKNGCGAYGRLDI